MPGWEVYLCRCAGIMLVAARVECTDSNSAMPHKDNGDAACQQQALWTLPAGRLEVVRGAAHQAYICWAQLAGCFGGCLDRWLADLWAGLSACHHRRCASLHHGAGLPAAAAGPARPALTAHGAGQPSPAAAQCSSSRPTLATAQLARKLLRLSSRQTDCWSSQDLSARPTNLPYKISTSKAQTAHRRRTCMRRSYSGPSSMAM